MILGHNKKLQAQKVYLIDRIKIIVPDSIMHSVIYYLNRMYRKITSVNG